jgi:hypothetical protein
MRGDVGAISTQIEPDRRRLGIPVASRLASALERAEAILEADFTQSAEEKLMDEIRKLPD